MTAPSDKQCASPTLFHLWSIILPPLPNSQQKIWYEILHKYKHIPHFHPLLVHRAPNSFCLHCPVYRTPQWTPHPQEWEKVSWGSITWTHGLLLSAISIILLFPSTWVPWGIWNSNGTLLLLSNTTIKFMLKQNSQHDNYNYRLRRWFQPMIVTPLWR